MTDEQHSGFFAKHPRDSFIAQEAGEGNVMVRTREGDLGDFLDNCFLVIVSGFKKSDSRHGIFWYMIISSSSYLNICYLMLFVGMLLFDPFFLKRKDTVTFDSKKLLAPFRMLKIP